MYQIPRRPQPHTGTKNTEIRSLVKNYTSNSELQNISLSHPKLPPFPPWTSTSDFIDLSIYDLFFGKANTPETVYRSLYQEKINHLNQFTKILTDGSIFNGSRGCAIIVNDDIYRFKLPNSFSIFSCKAFAILGSLNITAQLDLDNVAIFSDLKSVIEALKNFNSPDSIIQQCQSKIINLNLSKKVKVIWIPSHEGITGNELADREAKEATTSGIDLTHQLPTTTADFKKTTKKHIYDKWNTRWSNGLSHLHKSRKNIYEPRPHKQRRMNQCAIIRLRIGHTKFSNGHLLTKSTPKTCPACNEPASVSHAIESCSELNQLRLQYKIPNQLQNTLNDERHCLQLIKMLKSLELNY
ncbi:Protein of unknown function [Cotesia congregata]|uniref:RNase H type-1 domain-containing protein n=1 Tax=Cotesia congregata TaxID=51543 RepID=A0A8J2HL53_COTCN|nr:Protein of unknown function [Cotesia congregata]